MDYQRRMAMASLLMKPKIEEAHKPAGTIIDLLIAENDWLWLRNHCLQLAIALFTDQPPKPKRGRKPKINEDRNKPGRPIKWTDDRLNYLVNLVDFVKSHEDNHSIATDKDALLHILKRDGKMTERVARAEVVKFQVQLSRARHKKT